MMAQSHGITKVVTISFEQGTFILVTNLIFAFSIFVTKSQKTSTSQWGQRKTQRITKISWIYLLGNTNVCTKCHGIFPQSEIKWWTDCYPQSHANSTAKNRLLHSFNNLNKEETTRNSYKKYKMARLTLPQIPSYESTVK